MDEAQYKEEVVRLRAGMMSVARRYLADDSEAEDTVQDALLRLWQLHGRLSPSLDSLSWIIVRNLAIDRLSRRSNNIDIEKIDMADDPVDDDARYARVICLSGGVAARTTDCDMYAPYGEYEL